MIAIFSILPAGLLVIPLLFRKKNLSFLFVIFLAIGLGSGINACLTFLAFLISGQFNPKIIIGLYIFVIGFLIVMNVFFRRDSMRGFFLPEFWKFDGWDLAFIGSLIEFGFLAYTFAVVQHPFGEWDGWALWNMKTKFLIFGGERWQDIFKLHWHTQPDYPLLLPFLNAWQFAVGPENLQQITLNTGVLFTLSTAGLLYTGLSRLIPKGMAFLTFIVLSSHYSYIFRGTAQYADILLAYYILAVLLGIKLSFKENSKEWLILSGIFAGFMAFTKNEGLTIALLIILILLALSLAKRFAVSRLMITAYLTGLVPSLLPTVFFKIFLAPANRDILLFDPHAHLKFFNFEGCYIILSSLNWALGLDDWKFTWLLILFLILLNARQLYANENKLLTLFFITYFIIIFFIYLTTVNFDLSWRLNRTLPRILLYVLPSLLFFSFTMGWEKK